MELGGLIGPWLTSDSYVNYPRSILSWFSTHEQHPIDTDARQVSFVASSALHVTQNGFRRSYKTLLFNRLYPLSNTIRAIWNQLLPRTHTVS